MNGSSASEIEAAEFKGPAVGIPSPVRDRVVHDGAPDEHEKKSGSKPAALSNSADCKCNTELILEWNPPQWNLYVRDGCEHQLVDAEQDYGNTARWLIQNALQTKVFCKLVQKKRC